MASESSEKVVRLTLNKEGLAVPDQDPVRIQKGAGRIRWSADFDFQIKVEGYNDLKYARTAAMKDGFRCNTGTFPDVRKYKYTIIANGQENDPEVDVFP